MPLKIIREDITRLSCDAIVNAANGSLLGGGGVDGAIHAAAGPELLRECMTLGGCVTGDAKVTKGYRLPCNYVIHTVGPIWEDGQHGEEALLRSCYRRSMALALEYRCESMGFPLISAGSFGYPKAEALRIAVEEISAFLQQNEMLIYLVIFDKASFQLGKERFADIDAFINDHYVEAHTVGRRRPEEEKISCVLPDSLPAFHFVTLQKEKSEKEKEKNEFSVFQESLEEALKNLDESFSEMLLRVIDEKGMTDAECYKKANIDRKLFSKIRNDRLYRPSKSTAMAFAIALELPLDQARDMLRKAGFALSNSNITDVIVEYHIRHQNYDIHQINMDLFQYDQALLGA